ncbi:multidrug resistance-like protein [Aureobasidium sp. EXF-10727]|nr:multidrug resistance-like protein [Aureobasidium sp. EXF-10727]
MSPANGGRTVSSDHGHSRPSIAHAEAEHNFETTTMNSAQPRSWHTEFVYVSRKWIQQLLGKNPFKSSYLDLFKLVNDAQSRAILWTGILLAIAAGTPLPIIGYIFGQIITSFPPPEDVLLDRLYQLIGVACGYFIVTTGYAIAWGLTGERISRRFRETLVERLLGLEQAYFDVNDPDITNLLTEKIEAIQIGTSEKVGIFIQSISYFVAAFVVGFILNAKLTGILFAAVIPVMTLIVVFGSSRIAKYTKAATQYTEAAGRIAESAIHAVKVVQAFGMAENLSKEHYRLLRLSARYAVRKSVSAALMLGLVYFTAYSANALAFWEGSRLAAESGTNNAGTVYAVVFLIIDASFVVGQFGPFLGCFASAAAAGEGIYEILNQPQSEINVYSESGQEATEDDMKADLIFREVTFVYPARTSARALDGLNLVLKAGQMNAIVGTSGCGKSTLVSLLLRLYDISSGQLTIGSHDIKAFNVRSLRKYTALVDQDSVLFSGSILENISYGLGEHSLSKEAVLERCTEAAKAANLDFIDFLPQGIHTRVGNGGYTQLSGGQTQRICLARALVKRPSLLLLDEPTAALDANSEGLIMEAVKGVAAAGTTVVMVAHRLSTVSDSPNIVLMGAGKVIEQGNHDELMQLGGAYNNLIQAQQLNDSDESSGEGTPATSQTTIRKKSESENMSAITGSETTTPEAKKTDTPAKKAGVLKLLLRSDSPIVALGLAASIISGGIILGEAIVFGNLISVLNDLESPNFRDRADFFSLMFFIIALIAFFSYAGNGCCFGVVSSHFVAKVQHISLASILRQDMQWFSGQSVSSLMSSLNSDAGQLACLSGVAIGTIFTVCVSVTGGIILAHVVAWKIAVVLLAAVPVMVMAGYVRLRVLALAESRHRSAYNDAASIAAEACRGIRTIASLGRERGVSQAFNAAVKEPYEKGIRFTLISNTLLALSFSITYFVYALAYWWGARQVRNGTYDQLDFFIVLPALLFSAQSAGQIFSLSPEMSRAGAAARNVFGLHDQQPSIVDGDTKKPGLSPSSTGSIPTLSDKADPSSGGWIEFKNVSLCYPSKPQHPALQNVNISIKPGEFIALVGPSGAGKSTILSLLQRFYDPTTGSVLLDGQDIREVAVSQHRGRLGLVPQEPDLFPGSISYNIGLGAAPGQSVTQADIEKICTKCGIHEFVMSLPEGYSTECGTNGSKLSGGQKQRIAVARALIRSPEVLLLDEYTSALDAHSEQQIKEAVDGASVDRTTIVVAHRLSTVQNADRIFVFDDGRVLEVGSHAELVAQGGLYASMVKAQTLA